MAIPYTDKEISRTKNVKIEITAPPNAGYFTPSGKAITGTYMADKVIEGRYNNADQQLLEKFTKYLVNLPGLPSYPIYSGPGIKEISVNEVVPVKSFTSSAIGNIVTSSTAKIVGGILIIALIIGLLKWRKII